MTIKFIKPNWPAPSNIKALVTTRVGGVSGAPFESLNLGAHVEDKRADVKTNRHLLVEQAKLPSQPVWLEQVHSTTVFDLDTNQPSTKPLVGDGVVTQQKGVVCAVMTADCLPLFLTNQKGDRIGIVHAGWRGLADGIIEQGVKSLGDSPQDIIAWAGPCLSVTNFEIGNEVREQLGGSEVAYRASNNADKCYADLYKLVGERLANIGLKQYSHSNHCTFSDETLFYSHRRDRQTGRMASLIWME